MRVAWLGQRFLTAVILTGQGPGQPMVLSRLVPSVCFLPGCGGYTTASKAGISPPPPAACWAHRQGGGDMEGKALDTCFRLSPGPASWKMGSSAKLAEPRRGEGKRAWGKLRSHTSLLTFLRFKDWTFFPGELEMILLFTLLLQLAHRSSQQG